MFYFNIYFVSYLIVVNNKLLFFKFFILIIILTLKLYFFKILEFEIEKKNYKGLC